VDFGPDIKRQLMEHNVSKLDAVICTHDHADHSSGIDELRVYGYNDSKPVKLYSNKKTLDPLESRFPYMFKFHDDVGPFLKSETISNFEKIDIEGVTIQFFNQIHGSNSSLGFRINDFVYSNDVTEFPHEATKFLDGINTWVLDCVDYKRTHAHAGLEEVLEWQKIYRPKEILLTNLSHSLDYDELKTKLPNNVEPCIDGLKIRI